MNEGLANTIVTAFGIYMLIGLIIGLIYIIGGAAKIDPAAKGKGLPLQAKLIILPGLVGLWPLILKKLFTQTEPPVS